MNIKDSFFRLRYFFVACLILFFTNISIAKETNIDLLKQNWSFDGFFGSLIELRYKGATKSTKKFVLLAIQ